MQGQSNNGIQVTKTPPIHLAITIFTSLLFSGTLKFGSATSTMNL